MGATLRAIGVSIFGSCGFKNRIRGILWKIGKIAG